MGSAPTRLTSALVASKVFRSSRLRIRDASEDWGYGEARKLVRRRLEPVRGLETAVFR